MKQKYITKQEDIFDCGPACLSSIIKYYGGFVPMEVLRRDTFTNQNGTTAYHIVNASIKYGFDSKGYKVDTIFSEKIVFPAICHIVLDNSVTHFVVVYKLDKEKNEITLMDPSKGKTKISIDEFNKLWTKVVIVMIPKYKILKLNPTLKLKKLFIKLFKSEKSLVIKVILTTLFLTIFSVITSFYIKIIYTNLQKSFVQLIILFLFINVLKLILIYLRESLVNTLNNHIDKKIVIPFIHHLIYLPLYYVKNKTTGEIVTRIKELNSIKNLFSKLFTMLALDFILALITITFMGLINKKLLLLLLLILTLYVILIIVCSPKIKKVMETVIDNETLFNSILIENVDGLETIKNNNETNNTFTKIKNKYLDYLNTNNKFNKLLNNTELLKNIILELGIFIITSVGLYYIYLNKMTLLDLVTFNALLIYVIEPFKSLWAFIPEYNYIKTSFSKINDFLTVKEEKLTKKNEVFRNGDIKIKNLTFSYDNYHNVLNNYDLLIKEYEHVMIKGESGSGKSTICKLITRIYENNDNIFINNKKINNYSLNTIRDNIAYLSQKEKIFTDTIKNNILFYKNVDENYYEQVIKICRVDKIIKDKPLKDNTMLVDNGFNLSGGEIQRIVLARTLMQNKNIIILDEALSEIESEEETLIIKDIRVLLKDKTLIYVTHRNKESLFDRVIEV